MKNLIKIFFLFSFLSLFYQCHLTAKTRPGYQDFSNNKKLDSTQISQKKVLNDFVLAIKQNVDISNLLADSLFCCWEISNDSLFKNYNDQKISKEDFIKNYYPKVFNSRHIEYISNDKNIFSISNLTTPSFNGKEINGIHVKFGQKKCPWEPCGYSHFEFIKTKKGYKFYKLWHI
jgi:hypothetical protein|tara:strand:+ start:62 stop:586 length:525 start_codon:yes stop_codon:yes gene_type:complete